MNRHKTLAPFAGIMAAALALTGCASTANSAPEIGDTVQLPGDVEAQIVGFGESQKSWSDREVVRLYQYEDSIEEVAVQIPSSTPEVIETCVVDYSVIVPSHADIVTVGMGTDDVSRFSKSGNLSSRWAFLEEDQHVLTMRHDQGSPGCNRDWADDIASQPMHVFYEMPVEVINP